MSRKSKKSHYDPSRDTVGKIYRDLQINKSEDSIEIGDMSRELTTSLVEDINEAIKNFDKKEKPYFIMIEETRDLQMKNAIKRRIHYFGYRPWPEDNTTVFWKDPKSQEICFCWCLPHWSEMDLTLSREWEYEPEYIFHIRAWKEVNLNPFGFVNHPELKWIPNPKWKDKPMKSHSSNILACV